MSAGFTSEQILALAPDASSAKAGQGLASPRHWVTLGRTEQAIWGECQGSGKNPYQTEIDLRELAFKCSCPSRKFPCKHGLGLFLLCVAQPAQFTQDSLPVWVSDWLDSRQKRAEQQVEKQQKKSEQIGNPAEQAKRAANREAKVAAGLQELELWLRDLIRQGLAAPQIQDSKFWDTPARRLIDAQAPGLARMVREASVYRAFGALGYERMLTRLAKIHLLIEGYKRLDALPEGIQNEIRALIGWTQNQDELLKQEGVRDRWFVMGQRTTEEEKLRVQSTWLRSETINRDARILQFAHGNQAFDAGLMIGSLIDAELVFFPGAYPLRAVIKERHSVIAAEPRFETTIKQAFEAYAFALSQNPWIDRIPVALSSVIPFQLNQLAIRDRENRVMPITDRGLEFAREWELIALSGGHPIDIFGEWDGRYLLPLSVWANGRIVKL